MEERNEHVGTGVSLTYHARSENEKPLSVGATHTSSDGASADRGFSFGGEPLEAQRNPCPYEKPTPESVKSLPTHVLPNLLESMGQAAAPTNEIPTFAQLAFLSLRRKAGDIMESKRGKVMKAQEVRT